jgi:hypothetical protein
MPDFNRLKKSATRRRQLDEPPSREDTFENLQQPEHAPAVPPERRKTPRTAYLSLKITPEHRRKVKVLAFSAGDKEAGIIEKAIDLYFSKNPPMGGIY